MAVEDQLAELLARSATVFSGMENVVNALSDFLAGRADDPDSFDKDGTKTGPLGYYPIRNASGQLLYHPCYDRMMHDSISIGSLGESLRNVGVRGEAGAVALWQMVEALATDGSLQTVLDALPFDPTDPVRRRWDRSSPIKSGDPVATFIATTTGKNAAAMNALFAAAALV